MVITVRTVALLIAGAECCSDPGSFLTPLGLSRPHPGDQSLCGTCAPLEQCCPIERAPRKDTFSSVLCDKAMEHDFFFI